MKFLTIVIAYESDLPPLTGFGIPVLGCEVTALAVGDEIDRGWRLQEKLESLGESLED